MSLIIPVILSGGMGSRLWPLSRNDYPKQFLSIDGNHSLFEKTLNRFNNDNYSEKITKNIIVSNEENKFLILDRIQKYKNINFSIILEPCAKNTAPALTLAAYEALKDGDDPILLVSPADHEISDLSQFSSVLNNSIKLAQNGSIVILGVSPIKAETQYGYIEAINNKIDHLPFIVKNFVEKPSVEIAESFIQKGNFYWNSGIYILRASTWLNAIGLMKPSLKFYTTQSWINRKVDSKFIRPCESFFKITESISIDNAVTENCIDKNIPIAMFKLNCAWSDLGTWTSVADFYESKNEKDEFSNISLGKVVNLDSSNTFCFSTNRLIATLGVDDLIVIDTKDALLVGKRSKMNDFKKLYLEINSKYPEITQNNSKVIRPWGWYEVLDKGLNFKVKKIYVNPGASLSLQKHMFRAEHWIVVQGEAQVTCGSVKLLLHKNQSTFIPLGEIHRLANPGKEPLELIEIQTGSSLNEDDIIRFEDDYGRTKSNS